MCEDLYLRPSLNLYSEKKIIAQLNILTGAKQYFNLLCPCDLVQEQLTPLGLYMLCVLF